MSDVEGLARVVSGALTDAEEWVRSAEVENIVEAILASPWLAARVLAARAEGARETLEPVLAVLADEPPLLAALRRDMGAGFPNELSERRGRTITGWVDRLRAAAFRADDAGGER